MYVNFGLVLYAQGIFPDAVMNLGCDETGSSVRPYLATGSHATPSPPVSR